MIIRKGTLVLRTNYISNYHGVEDASLTMMFSGSLVGKTSQAGIFLNYLASYAWHMNYHTPEVGSPTMIIIGVNNMMEISEYINMDY